MARKRKITDVVINVNTKGASAAEKQLKNLSDTLDVLHKKSQLNIGSKTSSSALGGGTVSKEELDMVTKLADEYRELAKIASAPITLQVKQKGIVTQINNLQRLQEQILDTSDYAQLIGEAFDRVKDTNPFGSMEHTLEEIEAALSRMNGVMGDVENTLKTGMKNAFNQTAAAIDNAVDSTEDMVGATKEGTAEFKKQTKAAKNAEARIQRLEAQNKKLSNRLKDVNRQGTNQVRNFSAMAFSAGGVTAAYASVAATVFAVSEAFRILNEAASVDRLESISAVISNQIGVSIRGTAKDLQEATGNAVSYQQALRQAASAAAFGFDQQTIADFAIVAKRASVVLGVDMVDALNRVTRGVSKQEIELLDELGITVRLNEAFAEYANKHNIAANTLNSFQRQQALANAVIKRSEQNLGAADKALESTSWEKFGAQVSSSTNELLRFVATDSSVTRILDVLTQGLEAAGLAAKEYAYWQRQISGGDLSLFSTAGTEMAAAAEKTTEAANSLKTLYEERAKLEKEIANSSKTSFTNAQLFFSNQAILDYIYVLRTNGDILDEFGRRAELAFNNLDVTDKERSLEAINKAIADMETRFKLAAPAVEALTADLGNLQLIGRSLATDFDAFTAGLFKGATADIDKVRGLAKTLREAETSIENLSGVQDLDASLKNLKVSEDVWKNRQLVYDIERNLTNELGVRTSIINSNLQGNERDYALAQARAVAISEELKSLEGQENVEKRRLALRQEEYSVTQQMISLTIQEADLNVSQAEASNANLAFSRSALENAKAEVALAQQRVALAVQAGAANEVILQRQIQVLALQEKVRVAQEQVLQYRLDEQRAISTQAIALRAIQDVSFKIDEQKAMELETERAILESLKASGVASYETLRAQQLKVAATERELALLKASEEIRLRVQAQERAANERRATQEFDTAISQETNPSFSANQARMQAIELERQILAQMEQSKLFSEEALYNQRQLVMEKERELMIQQAQNAERMRQDNQNDVVSIAGGLNDGVGEAIGGILDLAEAWRTVTDASASAGERMQASLSAAGSFVSSLQGLMSAASGAAVSAIDAEIAAVKASGATQEEQEAKIKALNKKKIKEQEKFAKASILIDTAMGVAKALGSVPWPLNLVAAGLTAAAGALAYAQASNTASAQLAGLESSTSGAADQMTLTVGEQSNLSTDVSQGATSSERAFTLGDRGVYGRASAGVMHAGNSYITSEGGRELITPKVDSIVQDASTTEEMLSGKRGGPQITMQITALDSRSIEERAPEILDTLEEEAQNRGYSLKGD